MIITTSIFGFLTGILELYYTYKFIEKNDRKNKVIFTIIGVLTIILSFVNFIIPFYKK